MSQDVRQDRPSASSALEDSLCPGRWRLQREWDKSVEQDVDEDTAVVESCLSDTDMESGRRIHLLYARKACPEATPVEVDRAASAAEVDQLMLAKWLEKIGSANTGPMIEIREQRFWLYDRDHSPRYRYSGQPDLVMLKGREGDLADILIGDLKGLWGYHDPARQNQQLRMYIALIGATITTMGYTSLRSATAYLNQPARTMNPEMVYYDENDISNAMLAMLSLLDDLENQPGTRVPGEIQCRLCRAKLICPEYLGTIEELAIQSPAAKAVPSAFEKLPGEKLAALLPWLKTVQKAMGLAEGEAKRRLLADPASVPGWSLQEGPQRSKIVNVIELSQRLRNKGVTGEEFASICSVTKKALKELLQVKTKTYGRKLADEIKLVTDGLCLPLKKFYNLVPAKDAKDGAKVQAQEHDLTDAEEPEETAG